MSAELMELKEIFGMTISIDDTVAVAMCDADDRIQTYISVGSSSSSLGNGI